MAVGGASSHQPPATSNAASLPDHWPHSTWSSPLLYPSGSLAFTRTLRPAAPAPAPAQPLDILISGAGIGGLATAIALRLKGQTVTVVEQATTVNEVGAGIQIPPNASRLLERWGVLPYILPHATKPDYWCMRRWEDGAPIGMVRHANDRAEFGAEYLVIHRAHYHHALHTRAQELGVQIRLCAKVSQYFESPDGAKAGVVLDDGTTMTADVVVGADGVKGFAREFVNGGVEVPPVNTGYVAYRVSVEVAEMKRDPELEFLTESNALNAWWGPGRHVVTYLIRGGQTFNMVLAVPDDTNDTTVSEANQVEEMRNHYRGWDPRFTRLLHMTTKSLKWPTIAVPPLASWTSPHARVAVLGDAAHGMLPFMAQGAAMAVEDAAALAEAVSHPAGALADRMRLWEQVRMRRGHAMSQCSDLQAYLWHIEDGPVQEARDAAMRPELEGTRVVHSPNQMADPATSWWAYGHDAQEDMDAALQETFGR